MNRFIEEFKHINRDAPMVTKLIYGAILLYFGSKIIGRVVSDPFIVVMIGILLLSVILHEIAHGVAAKINGDPTAENMGRLSPNPIKHLDPLGTLLPIILIATGASFVIGWAKPVPVNFSRIKDKKWGIFQVAIAGVAVNFGLAFIGASLIKFVPNLLVSLNFVRGVQYLIRINLVLGIFNLIPIPPLDGSKVIIALGDFKTRNIIYDMERYGMWIIIGMSYFGILGMIISPFFKMAISILDFYIKL